MKVLAENRAAAPGSARAATEPEHRVGRGVDVEQRQRGHQPVVGRQLHPPREALAGHRVGAVGLGHELRAPGGARGRDEHRRVVRAGGARPPRSPGEPEPNSCSTSSRDDQRGLDLVDQARELGLARCWGRPARRSPPDRTAASQANRYSGRLCAVARTRSPWPTPRSASAGRRRADPRVRLLVGELGVLVEQPGLVRHLGDGGVEELGDRQRHKGCVSEGLAPAAGGL